jgi:hypothetical protein
LDNYSGVSVASLENVCTVTSSDVCVVSSSDSETQTTSLRGRGGARLGLSDPQNQSFFTLADEMGLGKTVSMIALKSVEFFPENPVDYVFCKMHHRVLSCSHLRTMRSKHE